MFTKLWELFKSSAIYSLGGLASRFIGVFLVPLYTRIFSPDQYGIIDLIATMTVLLNLLLTLGLNSAIGRYYVDAESDHDKKLTASTGFLYLLGFSFPIASVLIIFSKQISFVTFGTPEYWSYLSVAFAVLPFSVLFGNFLNLLKFRFQPKTYAALSVGNLLMQTGLTIYLVLGLRVGIIGIYFARLATVAVFSALGFWVTKSSYVHTFSFERLKALLYFGVPMLPLSLAYYIMTYSDRYFLRHFSGLHEVGLYGLAYRISSVVGLILLGFRNAWGPFVYSSYKDENARALFAKVYDYASILVTSGILAVSLFGREILLIFTTRAYTEAYKVIPFIAASTAAYTFGGYFAVGIGIAKKNIHRAWAGTVVAILNLGLNYLLIPRLGMIGAAVATILSFLVLGFILMHFSQRYYRVPHRFRAHFIMYGVAALIIFVSFRLLPQSFTASTLSIRLALLSGFAVVPFLLKLIGLKEITAAKKVFEKVGKRFSQQ